MPRFARFLNPLLLLLCCIVVLCCMACRISESYLDRGNRFFAQGKYQDAALNYSKAIQKDPKNGEAFYGLGKTELKIGRTVEAYAALSNAADLLPARDDVA